MGADGVMIAGCHPGECHYIEQNYKAMRRFAMLKHTLAAMGVEPDRVRLVWASAAEGQRLAEAIDKLVADVQRLGPLRWPANWEENGERLEALEDIVKEHEEAMEVPAMSDEAQGETGDLLGGLVRRLRNRRPGHRREDPRRGRGLRHRLLALRRRRQGPRRGENARRRASTSACSTAASAPASRNTWPN